MCADVIRLVWVPDVHLEARGGGGLGEQPVTWAWQTPWIVANMYLYNIQAVLCAGDMHNYTNPPDGTSLPADLDQAWNDGNGGLSIIDGAKLPDGSELPYLVTIGNHDYDNLDYGSPGPGLGQRDSSSFDKSIGWARLSRQAGKPWYVGYWPDPGGSLANQAIKIDVGGRHILIIALEVFPRPEAVTWAGGLINSYPTCEVIIITHGYMKLTSHLTANDAGYGPNNPTLYDGIRLNDWAKGFSNVKAILCGHDIPDGTDTGTNVAHRVDTATDEHPLVGIYANYQLGPGNSCNGCVGPSGEPPSQVVLLLELKGLQMNVRAFNTTQNQELSTPYPFILPWWSWSHLQLFYRGTNNALFSRWRNLDGSWSDEQDLGSVLGGNPITAQVPCTGILQLFYRGTNNALFSRWRNPDGSWSDEQALGGVLGGDPVAAKVPDTDVLQLFYRGTNNALFSRWRNPDGSWSDEQALGGVLGGDPVAAKVPGTDVLQLFYRGTNNAVYSRWRDPDGSWSDEQALGGVLGGDPVAAKVPGTDVLQLFYRGTNNALFSRWRDPDGSWSDEQALGGVLSGDPIAAQVPGTNILQLFYRGTNNAVYSRWRDPDGSWSDEETLGGVLSGDPIAAQVPGTDVLQLFYRGRNNAVFSRWRDPDGSWSDEQALGGVLSGDPIAALIPG